ncbi:MAG: hypothetical protein AABW67_02330 [Nanoarchaeota archaeon]
MKIPESITYPTGSQGEGYEQINEFFNLIAKEKIKLPINHPHIEKRIMSMYKYMHDDQLPQGAYSFDNAHLLFYKNNIIASVIETRTPFNDVHFDFFENFKTLEKLLQNP